MYPDMTDTDYVERENALDPARGVPGCLNYMWSLYHG